MGLRFKRQDSTPPELILVPFIDILLVVLIFMAVTTTLTRHAEMQIELPNAQGERRIDDHTAIGIQINAQGQVWINHEYTGKVHSAEVSRRLKALATGQGAQTPVIIAADAKTPHQTVITFMETARNAGLNKVAFLSSTADPKR